MKQCRDCKYFRADIVIPSDAPVVKQYGKVTSPCNRYPQNILRHRNEPACGEFKKRRLTHEQ